MIFLFNVFLLSNDYFNAEKNGEAGLNKCL